MTPKERAASLITRLVAAALGAAEAVETRDRLSVHLNAKGAIERVGAAGTTWRHSTKAVCGFRVREYGSEAWVVPHGSARREGRSVVLDATAKTLARS